MDGTPDPESKLQMIQVVCKCSRKCVNPKCTYIEHDLHCSEICITSIIKYVKINREMRLKMKKDTKKSQMILIDIAIRMIFHKIHINKDI